MQAEPPVTIYALHDQQGAVHYIGQTWYPQQRRRQHAKQWPQWSMSVLLTVTRSEADATERRLIAHYEAAGCTLANVRGTERWNAISRANAACRAPRPKNLDWRHMVRLSSEDGARVEELARERDLPVALLLRHAVRDYVERARDE